MRVEGVGCARPVRAVWEKGVGVEAAQRPGSFEKWCFTQELFYQCLFYLHPVFGLRRKICLASFKKMSGNGRFFLTFAAKLEVWSQNLLGIG